MKLPKVPRKTLLTALMAMAPLPFLLLAAAFFLKIQHLDESQTRLQVLEEKARSLADQKEKETKFLARLRKSEANFLEKHLESFSFAAQNTKTDNRLYFKEENPRRSETFEEIDLKQKEPVFLNEEELKEVLSLIEGIPIGSNLPEESAPQLIIKNFELVKRMTPGDEEAFELSLELIKREPVRN